MGQVFLSASCPRVVPQKGHPLSGCICSAHHQMLHVGQMDKEICKASVPCLLFTKGKVGRRSWVEPLGACPVPTTAWSLCRQTLCASAGGQQPGWGRRSASECHSGIVTAGALFLPVCVAWHKLPVSLSFPCIGMPLKA